jgi:hypothetical protein
VLTTLTASSYGTVHTAVVKPGGSRQMRSHPGRGAYRRYAHGRPMWCGRVHHPDDPSLGQPLCRDCYDYTSHVLFTWHAPELWRRFTAALRRQAYFPYLQLVDGV